MITLATLPKATAQEVFDQVKSHLLKQNRQSRFSPTEGCAYRGVEGLVCAAGCLISDEEYKQRGRSLMDGGNDTSWNYLVNNGHVPSYHKELINSLQEIHDEYDPEEWATALEDLADSKGLEYKGEF